MNRWVYRRPVFRAFKPKVPLVKPPGGQVLVRAIKRAVRRRAQAKRKLRLTFGIFTGKHKSLVRHRRVKKILRFKYPTKRSLPGTKFDGRTGVFVRVLKAIQRMRRKMQQRLRWKPRLEESIPPIVVPPTPIHSNPRGSVFSAGSVAGDVYSAGSKRGGIY